VLPVFSVPRAYRLTLVTAGAITGGEGEAEAEAEAEAEEEKEKEGGKEKERGEGGGEEEGEEEGRRWWRKKQETVNAVAELATVNLRNSAFILDGEVGDALARV